MNSNGQNTFVVGKYSFHLLYVLVMYPIAHSKIIFSFLNVLKAFKWTNTALIRLLKADIASTDTVFTVSRIQVLAHHELRSAFPGLPA